MNRCGKSSFVNGLCPDNAETGADQIQKFRLGYKDSKGKRHTGYTTQNAKAENLFINEQETRDSIYAEAARQRRCLLISTIFFELRHFTGTIKKPKMSLLGWDYHKP